MAQALYRSINIAKEYYVIALILMLITCVICFYCKHDISVSLAWALLVGYVFLVYSSTVIRRIPTANFKFEGRLFWSYIAAKEGKEYLVSLNIANVLMLIPVGFLVPRIRNLGCKKVALIGLFVSSAIEVSQLVFKRGLFEFDDIFHNTLGCVIGYMIYRLFEYVRSKVRILIREKGTEQEA